MCEDQDYAVVRERVRRYREECPELPRKSVKEVRDFSLGVYEQFKDICVRLTEAGEEEKENEFIWIMGPMLHACLEILKKVERVTGESFE